MPRQSIARAQQSSIAYQKHASDDAETPALLQVAALVLQREKEMSWPILLLVLLILMLTREVPRFIMHHVQCIQASWRSIVHHKCLTSTAIALSVAQTYDFGEYFQRFKICDA